MQTDLPLSWDGKGGTGRHCSQTKQLREVPAYLDGDLGICHPLTRPAIFPSYTSWTLFKIHSTMHTNVGFCWDGTFVTAQKRSHCVIFRGSSRNMPNSTTHGPDFMWSSCNQYEPRGRDSSRDCVCAGILF